MRQRRRGRDETGKAGGRKRPEPLVTPTRGRSRDRRAAAAAAAAAGAPEQGRWSKGAYNPVLMFANMVMFAVVLVIVGSIAAVVLGQRSFVAPGPIPENVAVIIEPRTSVWEIAQGLSQQGVISNQWVFVAGAYASGLQDRLRAGEYLVPAGASMQAVLATIVAGREIQHAVTLAEGLTSAQIVARLLADEVLTGTIDSIPAEGALLPETYNFTRGETRAEVIARMEAAQRRAVQQVWASRQQGLPLESERDLVVLASIVEKETGVASERPQVAGVFVNRLRRGMKLQSDPTILYGLYGGEAFTRPRTLTRAELDRPNAFSTYQVDGLPPGPIANPGREALEAVANPAATRALYFVADGSGGHAFAESYEEHQRNVARWREVERLRGTRTQ